MSRKGLLAAGAGVLIVAAVAAAAAYFFMGGRTEADSRAMMLPVDPAPLLAETDKGEKSFTIEVADDLGERSRGLMYRVEMGDDHGMLFVFERTQPVGFWMKDTPMPLDLLFIGADGKVKDILPGEPFSQAVISPREPVRFVLEFKRGTAEREGIVPGDVLKHPVIDATGHAPG